jgi:hypothetical protein
MTRATRDRATVKLRHVFGYALTRMRTEGATSGSQLVVHGHKVGWSLLVVVGLGILSFGTPSPAAAAQDRPTLRHCREVRTGTVKAVRVRASYRCRSARTDLKSLLRQGIALLPARKTALGGWSCRKQSSIRICKKQRRRSTLRISFRTGSTVAKESPGSKAPQECLDLWNASPSHAFPDDGYHFYVDHGIRQAWVFHMTDGTDRCTVIFVVPPTDPYYYEFGADGETENKARNGWILMNSPDAFGGYAVEVQTQAPGNANASLGSLGTITPL